MVHKSLKPLEEMTNPPPKATWPLIERMHFRTHSIKYRHYFMIPIDIIFLTDTRLSNTETKTVCQPVKRGKLQNSNHLHNIEHMILSICQNV